MLVFQLGLLLCLLMVCSFAPGFYCVRRLPWGPMEKLSGGIGLSLVLLYLASWGIYCFGPREAGGILAMAGRWFNNSLIGTAGVRDDAYRNETRTGLRQGSLPTNAGWDGFALDDRYWRATAPNGWCWGRIPSSPSRRWMRQRRIRQRAPCRPRTMRSGAVRRRCRRRNGRTPSTSIRR